MTPAVEPRLVLASASPRRRALLDEAGFRFDVIVSDVDEDVDPGPSAEDLAELLARRKSQAVAQRIAPAKAWVVGSDTVVAVTVDGKDRLLAKPEDEREAREMLELLSNSRHRVVTGVCVTRAHDGEVLTGHERTWVTMRTITDAEMEAYVASGEWRDKAGGYAIQENADAFVTELAEGGFDNVVGLPVGLTRELLERAGWGA